MIYAVLLGGAEYFWGWRDVDGSVVEVDVVEWFVDQWMGVCTCTRVWWTGGGRQIHMVFER